MRILVTRPQYQNQSFIDLLQQAQLTPVPVPLSEIISIPPDADHQPLRQTLLELDNFQKIIAVSTNAARLGAEAIDTFWPQWPARIQWFAVGSQTAKVLSAWGQQAGVPTNMTSEGLLALPDLQHVAGQKVLLLCGEGGRALLERSLEERGAVVTRCELYCRELPSDAKSQLAGALAHPLDVITVTSGEILHTLTALLEPLLEDSHKLPIKERPLIVPSERIAEQARELGWRQVVVAENATDSAMLSAVRQIGG